VWRCERVRMRVQVRVQVQTQAQVRADLQGVPLSTEPGPTAIGPRNMTSTQPTHTRVWDMKRSAQESVQEALGWHCEAEAASGLHRLDQPHVPVLVRSVHEVLRGARAGTDCEGVSDCRWIKERIIVSSSDEFDMRRQLGAVA
jgi:hypothetical protein